MRKKIIILASIIFLVSALARFWPETKELQRVYVFDEKYYIAKAENYLVGRVFFSVHPPVSTLLMAAGIQLFTPHARSELSKQEHIPYFRLGEDAPYNLWSARFFPKLLGSFVPVLLFLFYLQFISFFRKKITSIDLWIGFLLGFMASLELSFIIESRYAHATQIMMFFMLLTFNMFFVYEKAKKYKKIVSFLLLGIVFGLALATKWYSFLILPSLLFLLVVAENKDNLFRKFLSALGKLSGLIIIALFTYLAVYMLHFSFFKEFKPNPKDSTIVNTLDWAIHDDIMKDTLSQNLFLKMRDQWFLTVMYQKNMAREGEGTSKWWAWPIMSKPFFFHGAFKSLSVQPYVQLIYFIGNIIVWFLSFLALLYVFLTLLSTALTRKLPRAEMVFIAILFLTNWVPYAFASIKLYLYHYIPALAFSLLAVGLLFSAVTNRFLVKPLFRYVIFIAILLSVSIVFFHFSPFVYYGRISILSLADRDILPWWDIVYVVASRFIPQSLEN